MLLLQVYKRGEGRETDFCWPAPLPPEWWGNHQIKTLYCQSNTCDAYYVGENVAIVIYYHIFLGRLNLMFFVCHLITKSYCRNITLEIDSEMQPTKHRNVYKQAQLLSFSAFVVVCFWMLYEWTWLRDTPRPVRFHSFRQRDLIQQERRGPCLLIWAAVFEVEIKATGGKRGSKVQALRLVQLSLLHLYLYLHQEINSRLFHIVKFLQKEFFSPVCVCVLTTWQQSDDRCRHILPWIMFYLCLINILIYMCNTKPFCTFSAMKYKQDVDTFSSVSSTNSAWL